MRTYTITITNCSNSIKKQNILTSDTGDSGVTIRTVTDEFIDFIQAGSPMHTWRGRTLIEV